MSLHTGLAKVARTIVDPIAPFTDDGPVVVAAAGSAAIVPWALLPGLSGRAVSVSPSVTAAVAGMRGAHQDQRRGVLAVAGPEVPQGTEEAEKVADVHAASAATELLTGAAATGRAVLDAIPAGGLLHIAAHGHHEPENPLFSGVLLADGLLYGYDVAPNPSLPAQVVLSSCDVGRTDDRPGGEPLGLVAALLRSGVSTVVAGTSRVSDEIAAAVMAAYHLRLSIGQRPAIALAGAIQTVADQDADPAPFTCFGAGL
jgi:CHAT domain-containing protein